MDGLIKVQKVDRTVQWYLSRMPEAPDLILWAPTQYIHKRKKRTEGFRGWGAAFIIIYVDPGKKQT